MANEQAADLCCGLQHGVLENPEPWWPLHLCCIFIVRVRCAPGPVLRVLCAVLYGTILLSRTAGLMLCMVCSSWVVC